MPHQHSAAARAHNRYVNSQQVKSTSAIECQDIAMVYRRWSTDADAMLKHTYKSSDAVFHTGWFLFKTDSSRTFYVVDEHTKVIRQAIWIRLFSDMDDKEISEYQAIASHLYADSCSHRQVKSNAAANLGGGTMYAAGWRAGYENYLTSIDTTYTETERTAAAYGTYAPGKEVPYDQWTKLRADDQFIHTLYGKRFSSLLPVQFNSQQALVNDHGLPLLGRPAKASSDGISNRFLFSSNLTYTCNGFYNAVHVDRDIEDQMTFGIFMPVAAKDFRLKSQQNGYDQLSGGFINAHYKTFLDFASIDGVIEMAWWGSSDAHCTLEPEYIDTNHCHTHLGSSMQIAKALKIRVESHSTQKHRLIVDDATRHQLQQEGRMQ